MTEHQAMAATVKKDWKYRLGVGLLIYSFIPICTIELVAFLPLTSTEAVAFGAVYIGSGEGAFFLAVALLGKPFVQAVKDKIKSFLFRRREPSKPRIISKSRHYTGVALFLTSFLPYYITLGALIFSDPGAADLRRLLYTLIAGEVLGIISLLVLGEEFCARLKKLFEWPGKEMNAAK
ncbi:MAG TPA: hypothetical protein PKV86_13845 [Syntrophobacteraceae bacterium]|nr:hypothetical protein [Syntrophobacteraceae bacterium]